MGRITAAELEKSIDSLIKRGAKLEIPDRLFENALMGVYGIGSKQTTLVTISQAHKLFDSGFKYGWLAHVKRERR